MRVATRVEIGWERRRVFLVEPSEARNAGSIGFCTPGIFLLVVVLLGFYAWYKFDPVGYGEFIEKVVKPLWPLG